MFLANADPAADLAVMRAARENLRKIAPKQVVLVSSIAVYPDSRGKTEADAPDPTDPALPAYGRNRRMLELWVRQDFPRRADRPAAGAVRAGSEKELSV